MVPVCDYDLSLGSPGECRLQDIIAIIVSDSKYYLYLANPHKPTTRIDIVHLVNKLTMFAPCFMSRPYAYALSFSTP